MVKITSLISVLGAAAVAVVVAEESVVVEDAAIEAALGEEGDCPADSDPAACWLNALQLKAKKESDTVAAEDDSANACTAGLVGTVRSFAPDCVDSCPQTCPAMAVAINAYMTKGGQAAARPVICQHKTEFNCFFESSIMAKCQGLIAKAASFGFKMPHNEAEMNAAAVKEPHGLEPEGDGFSTLPPLAGAFFEVPGKVLLGLAQVDSTATTTT
eukprot:CAMPEP_0206560208 /NCGR_PEP_ID=MMETSP0325_2-20121206/20863_1 /ASSEMBLY_ACC=CAM_ASM_000347 /TAXON_ID=2866 /ORGANISM="Crypthecodinium cohnii, Strain Seligo" /LENGTH=213 /DNA_ID=CAMNT_0054061877 /DNA_START=88 /DNA_END=727 /DNA_ORIENTATION=+